MNYYDLKNVRSNINSSLNQLQAYTSVLRESVLVDNHVLDADKLNMLIDSLNETLLFLDNTILPSIDENDMVMLESDKNSTVMDSENDNQSGEVISVPKKPKSSKMSENKKDVVNVAF